MDKEGLLYVQCDFSLLTAYAEVIIKQTKTPFLTVITNIYKWIFRTVSNIDYKLQR